MGSGESPAARKARRARAKEKAAAASTEAKAQAVMDQNAVLQRVATAMDRGDEDALVESLAQGLTMPYGDKEREAGVVPLDNSDVQASIEAFASMHKGSDETRLSERVQDRVDVINFADMSTSEQMAEMKAVQAKQKTAKSYVSKTQKAVDSARVEMNRSETEKGRASAQKKYDKARERQDVAIRTQQRWDNKLDAYEEIYKKKK